MDEATRGEEGQEQNTPQETPKPESQTGSQAPPDGGESETGDRSPDVPVWAVSLPPQVRDAWIRGDFEKVPAEFRELIERYLIWLGRETRASGTSR